MSNVGKAATMGIKFVNPPKTMNMGKLISVPKAATTTLNAIPCINPDTIAE